jgi:hypothetical protein
MPHITQLHKGRVQPSGSIATYLSTERHVKNVFSWEHFFTYLGGPMDFAPDGGFEWRSALTEKLIDIGFKRNHIFSPAKKPLTQSPFDLDNEAQIMRDLRKKRDWQGVCETMSMLAHIDLRLLDLSNVIIVHFPLDEDGRRINTYGTVHEIVVARQQHKPVLVVWEGGLETCSGWIMWLVGHDNVFATFDELLEKMQNISNGQETYDPKDWLLIDYNSSHKERLSSGF